MSRKSWMLVSVSVTSLFCLVAVLKAEAPPTVWHALGIPQTFKAVRDGTMNKRGNHPGLEAKPPLKKLADPANLKSDVPAIKKAAEIKAQEDLAPQKIKAIKYLAKIGCGCHGGVAEALAAALEDCTEEVRFEAALAIAQTLTGQCDICDSTCCNKELAAKMYERAWGQDDQGCWIEPSERVRNVLREALNACPPDLTEGGTMIDEPRPMVDPGPTPGVRPMRDTPPPPAPNPPETEESSVLPDEIKSAERESGKGLEVRPASSRRGWQPKKEVAAASHSEAAAQPADSGATMFRLPPPAPVVKMEKQTIVGYVVEARSSRGVVRVVFPEGSRPRIGAELRVYHAYVLGTEQVGSLIVREYDGDLAVCSPPAWSSGKIARGDEVHGQVLAPAAP